MPEDDLSKRGDKPSRVRIANRYFRVFVICLIPGYQYCDVVFNSRIVLNRLLKIIEA